MWSGTRARKIAISKLLMTVCYLGVDPRVETHIKVAFVVAEGKVRGMR